MIKAHLEMDLKEHISVVSANLIELIKSNNDLILETLMKKFLKKYDYYNPDHFMDSLVFLYALDVLVVDNYKVKLKYV